MAATGDTRRIQTAVLGHKDSDEPLVLPLEAFELDVFRHLYRGATFWCGVLLGGCGAQLTTKLYTDRVCHFAHYPDPDGLLTVCSRTSRGVGSADHLYFKAAATAWLREQGQDAHFHFARPEGAPVGSVVDIEVEGGMRLRVHINGQVPVRWDPSGLTETVLGPGVRVDYETLARRRYVNRVRFYSDGPCRLMQIGTEALGRGTEWFPLQDCTMTRDGLVTPTVAELKRRWQQLAPPPRRAAEASLPDGQSGQPAAPAAAGAGPAAGIPVEVNRLVLRLDSAQRADNLTEVRDLCAQADRLLDRLEEGAAARHKVEATLEAARRWREQKGRLQQLVFARLQEALDGQRFAEIRSMLQQATTLQQQGHRLSRAEEALMDDARRIQDRFQLPGQARRVPVAGPGSGAGRTPTRRAPEPRSRGREPRPRVVAPPAREVRAAPAAERSPETLAAVAKAVRAALRKTAREGSITSWDKLRRQLGSALPRLTADEQARVLLLVDRATPDGEPLLSTLLAAGDPAAIPAFRQSAANLGLILPNDPGDLRDVLEADTQQVHRLWRGR
ncbi:hypothetical protein [Streptomyces sp. NPDC057580]|uniref:hypothetical protein n=1 Tax=Streptomyces sp. NPDC057580 TaxID=3346173 RepID=UPI00368EB4F6